MGGTFDPIHLGHLRAAEVAREGLGLDRVAFVPAGVPPHRTGPRASAEDRLAMVSLATAGHPSFVVADLELRREGPSYTVDTIKELRRAHPGDEIVLIVGSDNVSEIASWKESAELLSSCRVAVVVRPGEEPPPSSFPQPAWERLEGLTLALSATEVRESISRGRSVRYLLPESVFEYIETRGLYR
ncbi:MAG TPA: nicotinate-nucleotide adenylyltransferase [Vicinamibacteria bacterium]|jgi:nicotinate-nucleotide adenylyltransferase|nr:nicotinate-nucleotide adenylyltransferase [Vicinamibacteria bacterium]